MTRVIQRKKAAAVRNLDALVADLRAPAARTRELAARQLGRIGDPRAVGPLLRVLGDQSPDVWLAVVRSLRTLSPKVLGPLAEAQRSDDRAVRLAAARKLGTLPALGTPLLINSLEDADNRVRRTAAEILGEVGDSSAHGPLSLLLADPSAEVRHAGYQALVALGEHAFATTIRQALQGNMELVSRVRPALAVPVLLRALESPLAFMRRAAAEALGQVPDAGAVAPLLRALRNESADVRCAAAAALGRIGDSRAIEPLLAVLPGNPWHVQDAVADALGRIGDARVVDRLIALLDEPKAERAAARALGHFAVHGGAALPKLKALEAKAEGIALLAYRTAIERIEDALRHAPAELEASPAPQGRGTEPEAVPGGRCTELAHTPEGADP